MTIAFWSSVSHNGVTVTLAAVSVIWSEIYGDCVNVTSNHLSNDDIVSRLTGELKRERRERKRYCYRFGEPEYFRHLNMDRRHLGNLLNQKMRYLPMEGKEETDYFTGNGLEGVVRQLEPEELLFVDVAAGDDRGTNQILDSADILVYLLPKKEEDIEHFFQSCRPEPARSFFVLPRGRASSAVSRKSFCDKYQIAMEQFSEIRYSDEFATVVWEGRLVPFLRAHLTCSGETAGRRKGCGEEWLHSLTETAVMLHHFAVKGGRKECGDCEEALKEKSSSGQEQRQFRYRCFSWPASEQEDIL